MKSIHITSILVLAAWILSTNNVFAAGQEPENKLYQHVLMFKWSKDVHEDSKAEVIALFKGLPGKVEGFENIDILDVTESSEDYDIILILQFSSLESLKNYEDHEDHQRISKIAPPLIGKFASVDFWR